MGTLQFKNNASTTLSGVINNSQTSITVANASNFPVLAAGDYFYATMYEDASGVEINIEIVKVTETLGNIWTVARAQDGTTARSRNGVTTCYIELRLTAAGAQLMTQRDNNLSDLANATTARTNLGLGSMATQSASSVAITGGTISGVTLTSLDSGTTIQDNVDTTKQVKFEVSGVDTATTRTLSIPNASGVIALTSDLTTGYQPLDSDLTAFAALSANGLVARTGTGTVAVRALTQPAAGITVTNGDGVSGNPTLALANDLAGVEALNTTGFVRRTAADTWSASAIVDGDLPSTLTGKTYNGLTPTSNTTGFSLAGGTTSKTLTVNNSLTLAGTDGTTITLPATTGTVALNNQTFFLGTTSVAINRSSGAINLTGVSIDGSAGSATSATTATNLAGGAANRIAYQSAAATTTFVDAPSATDTYLRWNGSAFVWSTVSGASGGTVTSVAVSSSDITVTGSPITGSGTISLALNTVPISKGGTGATTKTAAYDALTPMTTLGDLTYFDGTDAVRLGGNTANSRRFLRQTGNGTVSAAPAWDALVDGDIPSALTGKTYNGLTLTAASTGFTVAGGTTSKTLTVSNTLTLAGTDSSTLNIGAGGTLGSAAFTASTAYAPAAGSSSITTVGVIGSGTWQGSAIGISYGGTGQTSKAAGFNALSPVTTLGDLIYGDGANSNTRLAGNTSTTKQFLTQTGNGTASAAPAWGTLADGDLPSALTGKTYNGLTLTANTTGFQVAGGTTSKTLVISNNLTFSGTDGSTLNIGGGGTLGTGAYATIANYATLASPTFTGTPAAPTAAVDTNTTQIATTAYVVGQGYLKSATASSTYAPLASPTLTGTPAAPTAAVDTNTTQIATTAYVVGQGYLKSATASSTYAPLASPTFTGTPAAPTAAVDANTTQVATTAYVVGQGYLKSSTAASTYQTQAGMSSYLTTAAAASTYLPQTGGTLSGNLTFSGTGRRITGDFSTSTLADRTAFQTSTTNGNTGVFLLPNGTAQIATLRTYNTADPTNGAFLQIQANATETSITASASGTGTALPMAFYTGGASRLSISTSGGITSSDLADAFGYKGVPINSQSAAYTLVISDQGKTILHPAADNVARTFTIPANSSVAFPVGTAISFINMVNTVTIAIATDTMRLAGAGTTGSRTLAAYGMATAVKVDSTTWIISGNGLT